MAELIKQLSELSTCGQAEAVASAEPADDRFHNFVQEMKAILWEADPTTWRFLFVSKQAEVILGYPVEQWLNESDFWVNHIYAADRERAVSYCQNSTVKGEDHEFDYRMVAADGRVVWLHDIVRVAKNEEGHPRHLYGLMLDITERKRSEEALRYSEERFQIVARATNDAVWDWNLLTNEVWWNEGIRKLFGYSENEVGSDVNWWFENIHSEDRERVVRGLHHLINKREISWSDEYRYCRADGSYAYVFDRGYVLQDVQGKPFRMIGAMTDISERKRTEEQSKRRLESLDLLIRAAQKLVEDRDVATLAQGILNTIVTSFGFRLAWIGHADPDGRVRPLYWAGGVANYLKEVEIRWDDTPLGRGPAGRAIATGRPVVMDVATDPRFTPWRTPALAYGYREVAAFPLKRGAKPFGNLILFSGEAGFFTPERVDLLQTYTHIAAAALENARLFDATKHSLERIRALQEIEQAITSTLDFCTVLDVLLEKIDFLLPYAAATVRLFNKESGLLEPVACRNLDAEEWRTPQWRGGRGLAKAVFESRSPTVIRNVLTDPRVQDHEFYHKHRLVSFLGIPLIVKEQVLGVISFYTREEHAFGPEEIELLSTLSRQAAIAIYNSQLYEQSRNQAAALEQANKDLERREAIQKLLKELSQDITSLDIDSLLRKLTEKVREVLKVDMADVRINSEKGWKTQGISGIEPRLLQTSRPPRGRLRWIIENCKSLAVRDITFQENLPPNGLLSRLGVRGYLGAPLLSREGEVIGVLSGLSYQPRDFSQEEIELLEQLANGAAVALENARLLEQTKQQTIELAKANKVKDEFLGFVSHELKTPVNTIRGYTELVRDKMLGELNSEQEKALSKVTKSSGELISMINGLLAATKIESGTIRVASHAVHLKSFLDELQSAYQLPLDKELLIQWDYSSDLPVIKTDGEKLKHALQNLIDNAIKYTDKGRVTISARHLLDANSVEFKVIDTGIGIPENALPFIFEIFRQVDGSEARSGGGVGLGLHIVKKFTELLGGKVDVQSERNKGSVFTVTLPYEKRQTVTRRPIQNDQVPSNTDRRR